MLDGFDDDISIPLTKLQQYILTGDSQGGHVENHGGSLVPMSMAKSLHDKAVDSDHEFAEVAMAWVDSCVLSMESLGVEPLLAVNEEAEFGRGK